MFKRNRRNKLVGFYKKINFKSAAKYSGSASKDNHLASHLLKGEIEFISLVHKIIHNNIWHNMKYFCISVHVLRVCTGQKIKS